MAEYKRLHRTLVHQGKITTTYTDRMLLPNGREADWDFIGHHGAAAMVAENEEGKILMVTQYRNALERYTLEIPAGGINPEENMMDAAIREVEEETGYQVENVRHLIDIYTTVAFCNEKIGIYCGKATKKENQHLDEDEFVEVHAYDLPELLDMIQKGKIQDSKTIAGILSYYNFMEKKK
ncbi:MAG: NUDIX hydrolase [Lachnospiraceae bacterium]|nr:NUDIX hydrolase [Lachnospiraceae bacterium]